VKESRLCAHLLQSLPQNLFKECKPYRYVPGPELKTRIDDAPFTFVGGFRRTEGHELLTIYWTEFRVKIDEMTRVRSSLETLAKFCLGAYFVLTSIYCLLAIIPYTYLFLIKEPPYPWMSVFSRFHPLFSWGALIFALFAYWQERRRRPILAAWMIQVVIAVYFTATDFLSQIRNNWTAIAASLVVLLPLFLMGCADWARYSRGKRDSSQHILFSYSNALLVALITALVSIAATTTLGRLEYKWLLSPLSGLELATYVLAAHVWLALLLVSVINLILLISSRFVKASTQLRSLVALVIVSTGLTVGVVHFLVDTLTFRAWVTYVFAVFFSAAFTLWGFSVLAPLLEVPSSTIRWRRLAPYLILFCLVVAELSIPTLIGEKDWNGLLRSSSTLLLWIMTCICIYLLRPALRNYSIPGVLAIVTIGGFCYWMLGATGFLWAKRLGKTDGEIARALETYAGQDSSFNLAHYLISRDQVEKCDETCRTLRQYTNIQDAHALVDLNLVDGLTRTTQQRPNIFIFVLDSVRRDYLGAYNPRVDFTPNLDAFARDSVVVRNAYTQYAGTTLSEPAIWTGALLLHAHYPQPFSRMNSLEKLAEADGYRTIVSYDGILSLILQDRPDLEKLDVNRPWNEVELSETLRELESLLDTHPDPARPILFYTQPMNVHQFARNHLPRANVASWIPRQGFNNRIAFELHQVDQFLGDFFAYLKSRGLYENSVIVVTADHGDSTGEAGRLGHSTVICPEVIRVPLLIHVPERLRKHLVYDPNSISALTDIAPTLYYLLGHRPVKQNPLFGRPLLMETRQELQDYRRNDLFLASDSHAAYGLLTDNGNLLFTMYDSPTQSFLFDLSRDPNATTSILDDITKKRYQQLVLGDLQQIAQFYEYKPTGGAVAVAKQGAVLPVQ
jgi:arylsulfatase A-like enzyme